LGFPRGLLGCRRFEYPLLRGGIKGGGRLKRVTLAINVLRRINKDTLPRFADPPSREGYPLGFPRGLLERRRVEYPLLRGGIKGGGRLMRVISAKKQRHSPPLRGPSLKGGLYLGLPLGEAGSRHEVDGRLMRVISAINVLRRINKDTLPRCADPPSREGYILGFPWGKLAPATKWTGD